MSSFQNLPSTSNWLLKFFTAFEYIEAHCVNFAVNRCACLIPSTSCKLVLKRLVLQLVQNQKCPTNHPVVNVRYSYFKYKKSHKVYLWWGLLYKTLLIFDQLNGSICTVVSIMKFTMWKPYDLTTFIGINVCFVDFGIFFLQSFGHHETGHG